MTVTRRFPVARPSLTELEERYVLDAVRSGWVSSQGPYLTRFEDQFAARCGARAAVATSNGTVALHLALAAAGVVPGDEVIVPALTYVATANAVTYCGARPVFVDVSPATWCINVDEVRRAVGPRTRAVIAVDLYGHPSDYAELHAVCAAHGLFLVADAAESLGARVGDAPVGALADATTFSFYGNKIITSGEGGCVTTPDVGLAERMRQLRNHGMDPDRRYFFPVVGFNYRLTNVAAAMLCAQLERSDDMIERRAQIIAMYEKALQDVDVLSPQPRGIGIRPAPWMASFLVGESGDHTMRDRLASRLDDLGVETRPFFTSLTELPPYRSASPATVPISEDLGRRGINLPTYHGLSDEDVAEIADRVRAAAVAVTTGKEPNRR